MRTITLLLSAATLLATATGCLAVSAQEVSANLRHEAVATPDGRIYLIDTDALTAREVRIIRDRDYYEMPVERDDDRYDDD